jgi:hypothetical protein
VRWAFSLTNAGASYTEFRSQVGELNQLDWTAISATDFRDRYVKEKKQAEFLVYDHFPLHLIERIGVKTAAIQNQVNAVLAQSQHRPPVEVVPQWYF